MAKIGQGKIYRDRGGRYRMNLDAAVCNDASFPFKEFPATVTICIHDVHDLLLIYPKETPTGERLKVKVRKP